MTKKSQGEDVDEKGCFSKKIKVGIVSLMVVLAVVLIVFFVTQKKTDNPDGPTWLFGTDSLNTNNADAQFNGINIGEGIISKGDLVKGNKEFTFMLSSSMWFNKFKVAQ